MPVPNQAAPTRIAGVQIDEKIREAADAENIFKVATRRLSEPIQRSKALPEALSGLGGFGHKVLRLQVFATGQIPDRKCFLRGARLTGKIRRQSLMHGDVIEPAE